MKNSLWLINLILLIILLSTIIYIGLSFNKLFVVPKFRNTSKIKIDTEPSIINTPSSQDIRFIEEKDIFKTVIPNLFSEVPKIKIPNPPAPKPITPYHAPTVQFLEALPITITGIIPSTIEENSQVIILNNNTKSTESYRVGDKLFDAYVIRILPTKIILIRSNGQQETIFMDSDEAKAEIKAIKDASWTDVILQQTVVDYLIDTVNFVKKVPNLAYLIEMLDATTAFKNDISVGCKIGKMPTHSIGHSLGLQPGDIITSIADIKPISTENRVQIYNNIQELEIGSTVSIIVSRRNKEIVLNYTLDNFSSSKEIEPKKTRDKNSPHEMIVNQEVFKPTVKKIKHNDKQAMAKFGNKNSVLKGLR